MADDPSSEPGPVEGEDPSDSGDAAPAEGVPSADIADFADEEEKADDDAPDTPVVVGLPKDHPGVVFPPEDEEPPASSDSPYSGLLRIRGEVDQTKAIALFLGGLVAFLLMWSMVTYDTSRAVPWTTTVGDGGTITLTEVPDGDVWVGGYEWLEGDGELTDRNFRLEGKVLSFHTTEQGEEVNLGYIMGHEPIVTPFILPPPGKVIGKTLSLLTDGTAYKVECPGAACPSGKDGIDVSGSDGLALERFQKGLDPAPPAITCEQCNTILDGAVAVAQPSYRFRWGLISTIRRTLVGFGIAVLICLPLGVAAGAFPPIKRLVSPFEIAGGYTPPVVLLPLTIALYAVAKDPKLLGLDAVFAAEFARTCFLVLVISFWLYPLIMSEVESVDEVYINTAYTLGASRWQTIRKVLVPVSMANIWQHLRSTYAIGWASIILAEGFAVGKEAGETGIGFFMTSFQRRHGMENYFACALAIVITGIFIDYLFKLAGRKLFPYQEAN